MSEINLDPKFSVYNLTGRGRMQRATLNHRRTMNVISHEIENATIEDGAKTRIFAAFQRMSRFLPQVERYRAMARRAEAVYVFGIMDCVVPGIENLYYVPLRPDDQLAKEWFLVSYGRDYASALATEELTQITDPDHTREFRGVWTFDPALTGILAEWLTRVVNANSYTFTLEEHNPLTQQRYIHQIEQRLNTRLSRVTRSARAEQTKSELKTILDYTLSNSELRL
jgi:DICT domain-containing protein